MSTSKSLLENYDNKDIQDLIERIEYLERRQDLLIQFVYEFFYNHYELMNEDDLGRLRAIIEYKGERE